MAAFSAMICTLWKTQIIKKLWQTSWVRLGNPKCRTVAADYHKLPSSAARGPGSAGLKEGMVEHTCPPWSSPLATRRFRTGSACALWMWTPASLLCLLSFVRCLPAESWETHNTRSYYHSYCEDSNLSSSSSEASSRVPVYFAWTH